MTWRRGVNFELWRNFLKPCRSPSGVRRQRGDAPEPETNHTMKHPFSNLLAAAVLGGALATAAFAENQPPGYVDFGKFTPSNSGGEFVEVKLGAGLIQMAGKFAKKHEPEVSDLLKNLQSVRVNVVPLGDDNREETGKKADAIRTELEGKGWEQIVNVKERNQAVTVFLKTRNSETVEGIVITVLEDAKQAVFVNVVGDVKLDQIAKLGDKLNLEPLRKVGEAVEKESEAKAEAKEADKK